MHVQRLYGHEIDLCRVNVYESHVQSDAYLVSPRKYESDAHLVSSVYMELCVVT